MMKFETINNTLCRMVEPEPLRPESQFPCVVRLIQDDSPMGRYNQSYSEYRYGVRLGCCMLPIIATHIAKNGVVNDIEWDVNRYEVIGYPIADGSAEWAWFTSILDPKYDMVCGTFLGEHCVMWMHDCDCYIMPANWMPDTSRGKRKTYDEFMRAAAPTGWQLYEPVTKAGVPFEVAKDVNERITECLTELGCIEPEPATEPKPRPQYKVGDWVEFKGKQYRISAIGGKGLFDDDNLIMFEGVIWCVSEKAEPRKLDPSEVIVKIGCLEGTVRKDIYGKFKLVHPNNYASLIWLSALDIPTRELVEALLKAQEEEK